MQIPKNDLERIVRYGVKAPSGDNCQPWRFVLRGGELCVLFDPARDTSLYNVRDTASLIACGALIENMSLAAPSIGYRLKVDLFSKGIDNAVATIRFENAPKADDPLLPFIEKRCTNRWPYRKAVLSPEAVSKLKDAAKALRGGELSIVESGPGKKAVAKAASVNDRLLFENRRMHDFLFSQMRWTVEEVVRTGDGLDVRTLGLNAVQSRLFRLLTPWKAVQALNVLGFSRVLPMQSYMLCKGSSALGLVQMDGTGPESFVNGGRLLQRVWLTAASLGLSFQPMTGITFLLHRLHLAGGEDLSPTHRALVRAAETSLKDVFPIREGRSMIMLFRAGYGPKPVMSLRRPLEIEVGD